jgi:hypothetical protein
VNPADVQPVESVIAPDPFRISPQGASCMFFAVTFSAMEEAVGNTM